MKALTIKQQLFVNYFCIDFNGTKAAILAGYSEDSAALIASENMRKPYIKAEIEYRLKFIMGEIEIDAVSIAREIAGMAFENIHEAESIMKPSEKLKALELLGRYHQMFVDRVETVTIDEVFKSISDNVESSPKHAIKH